MANKQKNFRMSEKTLEDLRFLVADRNNSGIFDVMPMTETMMISILIQAEARRTRQRNGKETTVEDRLLSSSQK